MPRGNGKQAQNAKVSGKLSAFVKATNNDAGQEWEREFVDWREVDQNLVYGALCSVVKEGGALLLGCSRDKRQYSVKVYADGNGTPYYFPCTESGLRDLEAFLLALAEVTDWVM